MLNRPSDRATAAQEAVQAEVPPDGKTVVETIPCDLQDFESVKSAAATIKKKYKKLDVLCNNAGVMAMGELLVARCWQCWILLMSEIMRILLIQCAHLPHRISSTTS